MNKIQDAFLFKIVGWNFTGHDIFVKFSPERKKFSKFLQKKTFHMIYEVKLYGNKKNQILGCAL